MKNTNIDDFILLYTLEYCNDITKIPYRLIFGITEENIQILVTRKLLKFKNGQYEITLLGKFVYFYTCIKIIFNDKFNLENFIMNLKDKWLTLIEWDELSNIRNYNTIHKKPITMGMILDGQSFNRLIKKKLVTRVVGLRSGYNLTLLGKLVFNITNYVINK